MKLRLFDAVVLAAGGLLVLKATGFAFGERTADPTAPDGFARVLAHARTNYEPREPSTTSSTKPKEEDAPKAQGAEAPPPPPPPPAPTMSPSERALLEKLGERRDATRQRDRDLDLREQILQDAERKLESRIGDLKGMEEKVEAGSAKRAEGEAGIKNIVTMYETMKPKDAARVFDRLALDVLVPVVVQMNPRKMAEVLGLMQPEAAERLTVALAARARGASDPRGPVAEALPPGELPAIDPGAMPRAAGPRLSPR